MRNDFIRLVIIAQKRKNYADHRYRSRASTAVSFEQRVTRQFAHELEIQEVLTSNKFFMDFYSQWKGVTRECLIETIRRFHQPDYQPEAPVLSALAKGFQRAVAENERM